MAFINIDQEDQVRQDQYYDFIIVGAGAAGIFISLKLAEAKYKILLLEHGNFSVHPEKQALNAVKQTGKPMVSTIDGRIRAVGGTTLGWGGQSLPFTNIDFTQRDWVDMSGWPINLADLADHYDAANRFMSVDTLDYRDDILKLFKVQAPAFNPKHFTYHYSKWAPEPNFQKLFKGDLKNKVEVLYNAHVTRLDMTSSSISKVFVKNSVGEKEYSFAAKKVILCVGAIETSRLLLNNDHQVPNGLGNKSGLVGKAFMEHPSIEIADVISPSAYALQKLFSTRIRNKRKYSVRITLSEDRQQMEQLLNCSFSIMFYPTPGKSDPYISLKNFLGSKSLRSLGEIVKSIPNLASGLMAYMADSFIFRPDATPKLTMMVEQEPDVESYIALTNVRDVYGLRKSVVHWKISQKSWNTIVKAAFLFKNDFEQLTLGKVKLYDGINIDNARWTDLICDVNHHMGGARMSNTEDKGVVDPNLKVWGVDNLYICSSSVFPTGSHSNPTLTILALASRLVNHVSNHV